MHLRTFCGLTLFFFFLERRRHMRNREKKKERKKKRIRRCPYNRVTLWRDAALLLPVHDALVSVRGALRSYTSPERTQELFLMTAENEKCA